MLESKVSVDFKVGGEAFHGLKGDVVQGRSVLYGAIVNEILGGLLIAVPYLEPFISAQMISEPGLAALALASDPVAEQLAFVGVTLDLDDLSVHEGAALAAFHGRSA